VLGDTDLTDPYAVERIRRSVAMLPAHRPGVLNREEGLAVLDELLRRPHVDGGRPTPGR
jgi:hypothetical protein